MSTTKKRASKSPDGRAKTKRTKLSGPMPSQSSSSADRFSPSSEWKTSECGTLLYLYPPSVPASTKVAGFDLDDTLIKTRSGKTFATDDLTDWQLWATPHVKKTLRELDADGHRVVLFSNQEGIGRGKVDAAKWKRKVLDVVDALGLADRVTVLASLSRRANGYRKPHVGMWRFLCRRLSPAGAVPESARSMYVGDAAGRPKRRSKKKDFSCTDYKFALNIGGGLVFKTPEELFLKSTDAGDLASPTTSAMGFQPKVHWGEYFNEPLDAPDAAFAGLLSSCGKSKEVMVIVGGPACGKSNLTHRLIRAVADSERAVEYVRINQDALKTVPNCVKAARRALEEGKSPVIDNTNRDAKARKNYVDVARSFGVPARCVYIDAAKDESFHANALRGAAGNAYGERHTVPDVAIHAYYKNMVEPTSTEGFSEVIKLKFTPGPFESEEHKASFYRYTR